MDENNGDQRFQSRYSTRTWKGCCVVPLVVTIGLLLLTFGAGLFDRPARTPSAPGTPPDSRNPQEFIRFGKAFFAIAQGADKLNEQGFKELDKFTRHQRNAAGLKSAFRKASLANHEAAAGYRRLEIPDSLAAQDKCRLAVDRIGESFRARERACETIIRWADDSNNQDIAREYAKHATNINTLTQEGLAAFAEAAQANEVTGEDAREFLPEAIRQKVTQFRMAPLAQDADVRKIGQ